MYALKFAHLVKEKTAAEVYQLYIDLRAFGKGYEEFLPAHPERGRPVIRGKGTEVLAAQGEAAAEGAWWSGARTRSPARCREIPGGTW